MSVELTAGEIRRKYDRAARWYDLVEAPAELLGLRALRHRLLAYVEGQVLEIAAGTGRNFRYYRDGVRLTVVELSEAMLRKAMKRAHRLGLDARPLLADGEWLPFPDDRFDAVVSSLTVCTFPDPVAALREMVRVCRPGGGVYLLEHGRSDRGAIARWQDRHADRHAQTLGCHWNREPHQLARQAGMELVRHERRFFGVFHLMEARASRRMSRNA